MVYGVTADGFIDKPIEVTLDELETAQKAKLGLDFDVSDASVAGQINAGVAVKIRELWEIAAALYSAWDPDSNEGVIQSQISSLSGTRRNPATKSTVAATVNLDAGVTLSAGAVASVSGAPASRFVTLVDATNSGGIPADISVAMEAEDAGATVANSSTLTEIETPSTGWNTITNALDASIGDEIETAEELRLRREVELRRAGAAAVDAIEADVSAVTDVSSAKCYENTTNAVDGDGVPPHAIEVVVLDGAANGIAQAIWDARAAGIEHHGDTSGTATDRNGDPQTVYFSRPAEVPIYVDVEVTVDGEYPVDGDTQIKTALSVWSQASLRVGDDVIYTTLYPVIFAISGVVDVTLIETGIAPAPAGTTNIPITSRQIATIDTSHVTVVST